MNFKMIFNLNGSTRGSRGMFKDPRESGGGGGHPGGCLGDPKGSTGSFDGSPLRLICLSVSISDLNCWHGRSQTGWTTRGRTRGPCGLKNREQHKAMQFLLKVLSNKG